jgi:antirestriction protein ArdC
VTQAADVRRSRYSEVIPALVGAMDGIDGDWRHPWTVAAPGATERIIEPNEAADSMIWNTGADIRHGADAAQYFREGDYITMPPRPGFDSCDRYYFVLFHELAHWSAARDRLNRRYIPSMRASVALAKEEILCDLAAHFLAADFDIPVPLDSQAIYVKNWLDGLPSGELLQAAPGALIICDYLHSLRYGSWGIWHSY